MEGYSVDEAATVLGVPTGRVWELLARGVLAGTQEDGAGMRVYLRARSPEPAAVVQGGTAERGATANGNGGHGDPAFEASPFRELLNEFRNLTERYGQALLALGEARGEVAGLRARVELLEARLDLRLPGPPGWASPWAAAEAGQSAEPAQAAEPPPAVEPAQAVEPAEASEPAQAPEPSGDGADAAPYSASSSEAAQAATHPADETLPSPPPPGADHGDKAARRPHRRRHGSHSAVAGIAEALARAEDPTLAPLPGAEEAAEALAALREEINQGRAVPLVVEGPASSVGEAVDQVAAPQAVAPSTELPAEELEGPMAGPTESVAEEREAVSADAVEHGLAPSEAVEMPAPTEVPASAADVTGEPLAPVPATAEPEDALPETVAPEAVPPEPVESTAVPYSSEWDEPDWIAEEDLDGAWEAPQPAAEETEVPAAEPPAAEIELAEAAEPEAAEAELVEAITPLTAEPAAAEAELVEAIIPFTAEPAEAAEAEAAEAEPMATVTPVTPEPVAEATEAEPMATVTPVTAEPAWEERPEERQLSEMAAWPPPPEDELAADMKIETALPATAEPEAVSAPATDDYLLLYEPAEVAAVSQPAAAEREPEPEPAADALEEELMWLGDEFRPSTSAWSGLGQARTPPSPAAPLTDEPPVEDLELERLARLRGWDENELSAIRSLLGDRPSEVQPARVTQQETPPPDAEAELAASGASGARAEISLPGADELDEAMAALGGEPEAAEAPEASAGEQTGNDAEPRVAAPAAEREAPAPSPAPRPVSRPPSMARMTDEDWLRGRRGPAANAYRRLRRLFPS